MKSTRSSVSSIQFPSHQKQCGQIGPFHNMDGLWFVSKASPISLLHTDHHMPDGIILHHFFRPLLPLLVIQLSCMLRHCPYSLGEREETYAIVEQWLYNVGRGDCWSPQFHYTKSIWSLLSFLSFEVLLVWGKPFWPQFILVGAWFFHMFSHSFVFTPWAMLFYFSPFFFYEDEQSFVARTFRKIIL